MAKDYLGYYNGKHTNSTTISSFSGVFSMPVVGYYSLNNFDLDYVEAYNPFAAKPLFYYNGADKSSDIEYCQTYSLNEMQYPTGGKLEMRYELNEYAYVGGEYEKGNFSFAGLRIGELNLKKSDGTYDRKRTFKYKELDENYNETSRSSGALIRRPIFFSHVLMTEPYSAATEPDRLFGIYGKITSSIVDKMYDLTGGFIGYSTVKEVLNGNGYIIYNYTSANSYGCSDEFKSELGVWSYLGTGRNRNFGDFLHRLLPVRFLLP